MLFECLCDINGSSRENLFYITNYILHCWWRRYRATGHKILKEEVLWLPVSVLSSNANQKCNCLSSKIMSSKRFKFLKRENSGTKEYCCVASCHASAKFNSVLSFHGFPTDQETRQKWIDIIRCERVTYKKICSRHFNAEDIIEPKDPTGHRLLRKGAVPTLCLWNDCSISSQINSEVW